jgi:hypothetical protein
LEKIEESEIEEEEFGMLVKSRDKEAPSVNTHITPKKSNL